MAKQPKRMVEATTAAGEKIKIDLTERMPDDHATYGGLPRFSSPNAKGEVVDRTTLRTVLVPSMVSEAA